ncbi:hypothetical protein BGX38DRAFT_1143030 [Terfezia claveryi]|nr:hypothetical protein BGX38DRAFT_1143030 [Terfezia claveryi]
MAATIHLEDVNALVALASTIPRSQNPTLSRHDPEVHENRLNVILDAIASICVSQPKGEVYSTAMELVPGPGPAGEVRLFVAGNVDVSEDVGKHIQELWIILKNIARDCFGARKLQNPKDPCLQWGYQGVSPPRNDILATEDLKRLKNELLHKIYNHSFPKFVARVQKRWDQYLEFWGIMRKEIILGEDIPSEILPLFCLRKLGDLMWGTEQRKATTRNVDLSQIIQLVQRMKNLLGSDPRVYERLCLKVAEYEGPNLPLTRYLEKIVSLHVSADVLVRYACSPRLRTHFTNKKFVLTTVSNTPYTGYLPTTREQWMACLQKALSYTSYETSSMKFVDGTQGMDEEYELRIHCEVALTLYLREHLKGIRETTGINFVTKGCHQKWYFPWGFPQQQSHRLRVAAYTAVGNALGSDIYAHGWAFLRTYSDSSAFSIDSTAVSKEEEDDDKQWAKAMASHSNY